MRFRKDTGNDDEVVVNPQQVYCGIHTVRLSVSVKKSEIRWPEEEQVVYDPLNGSIEVQTSSRDECGLQGKPLVFKKIDYHMAWGSHHIPQLLIDSNGHAIRGSNIRLEYNRANVVLVEFEPLGHFQHPATDLLPFPQFPEALARVEAAVAAHLCCPTMFNDRKRLVLNRIDIAWDYLFYDPSLLLRSLHGLEAYRRNNRDPRYHEGMNCKCRTESGEKEFDMYVRSDKAHGYSVLRFEYRLQSREAVRNNLRVPGSRRSLTTDDMVDEDRLSRRILGMLKQYNYHPQTRIVPLAVAERIVQGEALSRAFQDYPLWVDLGAYSRHARDLRQKYGIAIGTMDSTGVVAVRGLYEALVEGLSRAWE